MSNHAFGTLEQQWRDLEACGIPLELPKFRVSADGGRSGSGLTIRRGRNVWRSEIRELKKGSFAYILPVFIRRDHPGKTIIRDCWISPPWMDTEIEWLEDPKEQDHPRWYSFPGDRERFFREGVVNHRVNCNLFHGDIREGLLLAVGVRPPEIFKNHDEITVTFTIMDQWDCEHSAKMQMRMNRLPARVKASPKPTRRQLLSKRDVIAQESSLVAPKFPLPGCGQEVEKTFRQQIETVERQLAKKGHRTGMVPVRIPVEKT
jgi:hypothetical protein